MKNPQKILKFLGSLVQMENHQFLFPSPNIYKNNFRSALLSSVKNKKRNFLFRINNPDTFFLNQFISKLPDENYKSVILEVSSHAIHQKELKD